tara:strand:- start:44 stop:295 length:252 start_codon:yes stop_codon:yes gene_type:complete
MTQLNRPFESVTESLLVQDLEMLRADIKIAVIGDLKSMGLAGITEIQSAAKQESIVGLPLEFTGGGVLQFSEPGVDLSVGHIA